jgi:hypothetical protein
VRTGGGAIVVFDDADPRPRVSERWKALAAVGVVATLLVASVIAVDPWRSRRSEATISPTATPIWDLTQISESEKWGRIWSLASGAPVLRPTWLPSAASGSFTTFDVDGGSGGLDRYRFQYVATSQIQPGSTVRTIEVMTARSGLGLGMVSVDASAERLDVNGHSAELVGVDSVALWQVWWSDIGYAYGVQTFGYSREDVLRIASSLAHVVDARGGVGP